ncbi:MAG: hypothetical protein JRI25_25820 [Deltaproteobacteria bacterium]|nr:hypothetical protein [Deltaproteobacteria bacterium]
MQFLFGRLDGFSFQSNAVINGPGEEDWACVAGVWQAPILEPPGGNASLAHWEQTLPTLFSDNTTEGPGFVDGAGLDFHLQATSPLVDRGAFLTTATGTGPGTVMTVVDSRYFHDGLGVEDEPGDWIQLEGQTETAQVLAVNVLTEELTLDRTLEWTDGQGVALTYVGSAPDIGAFEYGDAGDDDDDDAADDDSADGDDDDDTDDPPPGDDGGGCDCRIGAVGDSFPGAALLILLVAAVRQRKKQVSGTVA